MESIVDFPNIPNDCYEYVSTNLLSYESNVKRKVSLLIRTVEVNSEKFDVMICEGHGNSVKLLKLYKKYYFALDYKL